MYKKILFYLFSLLAFTGCKNNTFLISGTLTNPVNGEYIFLDQLKSNELTAVDSVKVSNDGKFIFKGETKNPAFYLVKFNNNNFLTLLVGPGDKILIKANHDSLNFPVSVEGSKGTEQMAEYNRTLNKTIDKLKSLNDIYMKNSDNPNLAAVMDSLDNLAQGYLEEINSYTKNYIDRNLGSLVSLVALYQQVAPSVYVLHPEKDINYFEKVDSSMYSKYPDYDPVATLHEQVKQMKSGFNRESSTREAGVGAEAPEISLPDPEGDTIRLSSTRGSVVLLDFWASWCNPCRRENPNLVKAYSLYHNKGFQIFQVSLDKTKEAWLNGIKDDQLGKWIHVSDLKYWNSVVVPLYKIESIPCNFLLDKEGRIIASNLTGDQLQNKLAEILNK
jgi:peroxiredoxin